MRKLLSVLFLLLFAVMCAAQPQHLGGTLNVQIETTGSGNGAIAGFNVQNFHAFKFKTKKIGVASQASFTLDKKEYRNQFGGALRFSSVVRVPLQYGLFIGGGVGVSGIVFSDLQGSNDGYAKYNARPVAAAGYAINGKEFSTVVQYQYRIKRALWAQENEVKKFKERHIDGWTGGQQVDLQSTINIKQSKWIILVNFGGGRFYYRRNPVYYGAELGAVTHRFNAYTIDFGLGHIY